MEDSGEEILPEGVGVNWKMGKWGGGGKMPHPQPPPCLPAPKLHRSNKITLALQAAFRGIPSVFSKAIAEGILSSSISVLFCLILSCCDVVSTAK